MAQFESGIVQNVASIGTVPTMVWNPGNTSSTTFGSLGSVSSTAVLTNPVVANTGTNTIYVSSGSVAVGTSFPTGIAVPAGGEAIIYGYSGTGAAAGTIWAQTGVVGQTSSSQAGMSSVFSVI